MTDEVEVKTATAPVKKTTKKPAAKKTTKKAPAKKSAGRTAPDAKITVLAKDNPYHGSRGQRFDLLKSGQTVAEYRAACDKKKLNNNVSFLRMMADDGNIKLS